MIWKAEHQEEVWHKMDAWSRSKSRQGFGVGFRIFDVVERRVLKDGKWWSPWKLLYHNILLFPALLNSRSSTEIFSSKDSKLATPSSRSLMHNSTSPSFLPCIFLTVALWVGHARRSRGSVWVSDRSPILAADAFVR
jgi:hypothetical protein